MATKRGSRYVPDRGDLVWLTFDPQAGHEQAGRRPAVVLSPATYNERATLALVVPVTRQIKGYPFEVRLSEDGPITGAVLADQLKSLDWRVRKAEKIATLPEAIVLEILTKRRRFYGRAERALARVCRANQIAADAEDAVRVDVNSRPCRMTSRPNC